MSKETAFFAGLPICIPLRIINTGESHLSRTYWFTSTFTSGSQSINGLLVAYLRKQSIPYTRFYGQVWFVWTGCWCRCDYETEGLDVRYYLLEYIQN